MSHHQQFLASLVVHFIQCNGIDKSEINITNKPAMENHDARTVH